MPPRPPPTDAASRAKFAKRTLLTVFVALLIDILAFTIILPLYPRILEYYEKTDGGDEQSTYYAFRTLIRGFRSWLGMQPNSRLDIILFGGFIGSLFSFLQFVSSPIIGRASDRYGRRTVLLLSMIGNGVSMLLWIFSKSFTTFVLSRIVGGLTEGNVQMSIAIISDLTTVETRSKGLALVGIAFSLGFTVGPPLGAYFTKFNLQTLFPSLSWLPINEYSSPALFALVLIVIETVYLFAALPETVHFKQQGAVKAADKKASPSKATTASKNRRQTTAKTNLSILSLVHFLFLFVFSGMEFTLTFLTHDRFSYSHASQGRLLAFIGVLSALVQGVYVRRYAHKFVSERDLAIQGMLSCAFGLGVLGLLAEKPGVWLWVGAAGLAVTSGTVVTSLTALASHTTSSSGGERAASNGVGNGELESGDSGHVLGKFRSAGQLGRSLGPVVACSGYWLLGSERAYGAGAVAMVGLVGLVGVLVPRPAKKKVV
ncbi:hypothetical protein HK104_008962 [Borealophlyctis nickersoniae]|nr:hypothetical protein HK104_008962 [Borealophlyctis nickersoniae]